MSDFDFPEDPGISDSLEVPEIDSESPNGFDTAEGSENAQIPLEPVEFTETAEVAESADTNEEFSAANLDPSQFEYRTGEDLSERIEWARWAGGVMAAEERYEAGLAAQQAGDLGDAVDAFLKNRTAGEASESMADKMIDYLSNQDAINPELRSELGLDEEPPSDSLTTG